MTERSPVSLAVDRVLADGAWHDVDEVLRIVAAKVPPGRAYRVAESARQTELRKRGRPDDQARRSGTRERAIASGARREAHHALRHRIRDGAVERDGNQVRRRP